MSSLAGKSILVTGGTGSFGKKCVEMLLGHKPKRVIVFSRDELKQHDMQKVGFHHPSIRYFVGDVRDRDRLTRAMRDVEIVIHAAALKQVPSCEYNPMEAIMTNVMGTKNIIDAALDTHVEKVIALSTDKAVNPINLYGATKLCAEKLIVQSNAYSGADGTRFACVRYGNVVGSRGSVIPIFLEQRQTGRLTVTDHRMTRFFISLEQGVSFVLHCLGTMKGGEVFVPKIPSLKMTDLAHAIAPECRIDLIGIRPGEKLHEVLIAEDEARHATELENMFIIEPLHPWWSGPRYPKGKRPTDGFTYTSANNAQTIQEDDIQNYLESLNLLTIHAPPKEVTQ